MSDNKKELDSERDKLRQEVYAQIIKDAESSLKADSAQLVKSEKSHIGFSTAAVASQNENVISRIISDLNKAEDLNTVQRLSFVEDPSKSSDYTHLIKRRNNLIPPEILKRIRDTEELIGGVILPARSMQLQAFARPRANRFDVGFSVDILPEVYAKNDKNQVEMIKRDIIPKLRDLLLNCGSNEGYVEGEKRTLAQFFNESSEDLLLSGAFAAEIIKDNKGDFHSFRASDSLTLYQIDPRLRESQDAENVRNSARRIISYLKNVPESDIPDADVDKYTWVQVIDNQPKQVFTDDEMLVMFSRPSTDIKRNGYPVSPVERILSSVATHINQTSHNKLFFINGRAARNILVFKAKGIDQSAIEMLKAQFNAHINSVNAAWRMPVFGMGPEDEMDVVPIDGSGRDMEFQYLSDLNKRMIFAAYQMSPDEVAAMSYLSRGTNSQALSESNNEWKLTQAQDMGLRPLLMLYEDFFNLKLLPHINKEWSKYVRIDFSGIDADSPEKEATRLQQDSNLYLTMNKMLSRVEEKETAVGGDFPLNPAYLAILEKYYTKGQLLKAYGGPGYEKADQDPELSYCLGDPTSIQMFAMKNAPQQPPQGQPGLPPGTSGNPQEDQQPQAEQQPGQDLDSAIDQLASVLTKAEDDLPASRKELLKSHKKAKKKIMKDFEDKSKKMVDDILDAAFGANHKHDEEK